MEKDHTLNLKLVLHY